MQVMCNGVKRKQKFKSDYQAPQNLNNWQTTGKITRIASLLAISTNFFEQRGRVIPKRSYYFLLTKELSKHFQSVATTIMRQRKFPL